MLVFAGFGFVAPIVTFLIATSSVSAEAKIAVLTTLAVIYTYFSLSRIGGTWIWRRLQDTAM